MSCTITLVFRCIMSCVVLDFVYNIFFELMCYFYTFLYNCHTRWTGLVGSQRRPADYSVVTTRMCFGFDGADTHQQIVCFNSHFHECGSKHYLLNIALVRVQSGPNPINVRKAFPVSARGLNSVYFIIIFSKSLSRFLRRESIANLKLEFIMMARA